MAEHGVKNVDSASSEAENGLVVTLALSAFAVVVEVREGTCLRLAQAARNNAFLSRWFPKRLGTFALIDVPDFHGLGPRPA